MSATPLISCLMVTPGSDVRLPLIQKSIDCFIAQTYAPRELVIVLDTPQPGDVERLQALVADRPEIRLVEVKNKISLGALRNRTLAEAKGELVCQWDDDDIYHRTRLEFQYAELAKAGADVVYLQNLLHYFPKTREIFWTNWAHTERKGHPATLMCKTASAFKYPEEGEKSQKGEDLAALLWLREHNRVAYLNNPVYLYTYLFHGTNTWHAQHHKSLAFACCESRTFINAHKQEFLEAMKEIPFTHEGFILMDKQGMVWPCGAKRT